MLLCSGYYVVLIDVTPLFTASSSRNNLKGVSLSRACAFIADSLYTTTPTGGQAGRRAGGQAGRQVDSVEPTKIPLPQRNKTRERNESHTGSGVKLLLLMVPSSTACTHARVSLRDMRLPTPWPPPVHPVLMRKHCVPCLASFFWSRSAYLSLEGRKQCESTRRRVFLA